MHHKEFELAAEFERDSLYLADWPLLSVATAKRCELPLVYPDPASRWYGGNY